MNTLSPNQGLELTASRRAASLHL